MITCPLCQKLVLPTSYPIPRDFVYDQEDCEFACPTIISVPILSGRIYFHHYRRELLERGMEYQAIIFPYYIFLYDNILYVQDRSLFPVVKEVYRKSHSALVDFKQCCNRFIKLKAFL